MILLTLQVFFLYGFVLRRVRIKTRTWYIINTMTVENAFFLKKCIQRACRENARTLAGDDVENGRGDSAVVSLWNPPGVTFFQRALLIIIIDPGMPSRPERMLLSRERVSKNAKTVHRYENKNKKNKKKKAF